MLKSSRIGQDTGAIRFCFDGCDVDPGLIKWFTGLQNVELAGLPFEMKGSTARLLFHRGYQNCFRGCAVSGAGFGRRIWPAKGSAFFREPRDAKRALPVNF